MPNYELKGQVDKVITELEKESERVSKRKKSAAKGSYEMGRHTGEQEGLATAIERLKSLSAGLPDIRADHDL